MKSISVYLIAVIIMLAFALSIKAVINDPTLIVHYSFDEGKGNLVKDDSQSGNDGEIMGNPKWEDGPFGKAIVLEEQTWVDMKGPNFNNKPKEAVSLCVWVNHNGSADPQSIFDSISDVPGAQGLYHVEIRPGGFRWFHRNVEDVEIFNINPGPIIAPEEWVHFAGTYDSKSGDVVTYINGKKTHEGKGKGELEQNWNQQAEIGHHVNTRWYDGRMDEFYIFTRALLADEVNAVMNGEFLSVRPKDKLTTMWSAIKIQ